MTYQTQKNRKRLGFQLQGAAELLAQLPSQATPWEWIYRAKIGIQT